MLAIDINQEAFDKAVKQGFKDVEGFGSYYSGSGGCDRAIDPIWIAIAPERVFSLVSSYSRGQVG